MYVLVYDVANDRCRRRLHRRLRDYGEPVQLSVFEVSDKNFPVAIRACLEELPPEGKVRVYRLCSHCSALSVPVGGGKPVDEVSKIPAVIELGIV